MLTVACVLRSGGVYNQEWVKRLRRGVAEHLARPHRFVCLTDQEIEAEGVVTAPLFYNWPGWWSKVELFRPDLFAGPVLYLDLDSLVVGPLDDLIAAGGFWMIRDFLGTGHNSGAMFWQGGGHAEIWRQMRLDAKAIMRRYDSWEGGRIGDQAFIEDVLAANAVPIHTFAAGQVVSWRKHAQNGPPPGARVVSFHGRRKMPEARGWATKAWENLA